MLEKAPTATADTHSQIRDLFERTRACSERLVAPLNEQDMMLQSMEDASPAKWHLAHTTWFFEEFILKKWQPDYQSPDDRFSFLFNSYYVQAGPRHTRNKRGLLSRPDMTAVHAYRAHVEAGICELMDAGHDDANEIATLVELGCHHEMQHQELLVTDLLHGLSYNPLLPIYHTPEKSTATEPSADLAFTTHQGGLTEIGHTGADFAFDCEGPRHQAYVAPFALANRAVTNRDWICFMQDGGYDDAPLWLMDGHAVQQSEDWRHPLYWWQQDDEWWTFTLQGARAVNLDAPVVHVSYYEADAFARWAGARLPTEEEQEIASRDVPIKGNFLESGHFMPMPQGELWGDVWEWTQSPFTAYPGFKPATGAIGEYNGKFMVNQFVLRGGSCVTPKAQMRPTYRTFFYPHQRWQMLGLRLAQDV